jgi:two-component system, NtrC family, sensor kinase
MRLTVKLVTAFVVGNVLLAAIYGYLAVRREVRMFEQTATDEAESLGNAMEDGLADAWRRAGHQGVLELLHKASGQEYPLRIRWVWFDSQPGTPFSPSAPAERLTTITIQRHVGVYAFDPEGEPCLHIYWPVALNADRRGGLEFSRPTSELDENQREIVFRTAYLIGGMVLLSGLLATLLGVRLVGTPLRLLIEKTQRVASGDLQGPIVMSSHDELAQLGESLNRMCEQLAESQNKIREETAARLAAMEQLRHADRLQTVGRLASGIAHELGTPLNVVSGRASLIQSGRLSPDEISQSAAAIKAEADKMTRIIRQLLDFARCSTPHKASVDLREVVRQTVDLLATLANKRKVELCFTPGDEPALTEVDIGQIQQALTNLIVNAIQAMPNGGKVDITLGRKGVRPPNGDGGGTRMYHAIDVRDQGVGIPEEHMQHLFEPFFTTKEVGEGTGLGLSIAYGIVQEHGGWIDGASRAGEGSCFTIYLPEETKP